MIMVKRWLTAIMCVALMTAFSGTAIAAEAKKVDLNKASVEELTQLEKIGPQYAKRIIEYRTKNGPFKTVEDITKVKGIGKRTYELNKDRIIVKLPKK